MALRPDEEHCRASFDRYLLENQRTTGAVWAPFSFGDTKPPDFFLHCGGSTYAVEATSLFTQYEQPGGKQVSEESIWKATEKLAEQAEREASDRGILRGSYVLAVGGPYDRFFLCRRELRGALLNFIASTREADETPAQLVPVESASGQRYFLNKLGPEPDAVVAGLLSDGGGWGWEIVNELRLLVEDAVTTKARKLLEVPRPWILLLLDRHHFARAEDYEKLKTTLTPAWEAPGSDARAFHFIYLINSAGGVFALGGTADKP